MRTLRIVVAAFVLTLPLAAGPSAQPSKAWKETKANKPETCRTLWEAVGLPSYKQKGDTTVVCHMRYVLSHNNPAKTPDFVVERLTKKQVSGKNKRPSKQFASEPKIRPDAQAVNADYTKTKLKFARGHMAPSGDFNQSPKLMRDSFFYSNAVPQVGTLFNSSIWSQLEDEVRQAAKARNEIYVITGPIRRVGDASTRVIAKSDNPCGNEIVMDGPAQAVVCGANNKKSSVACTAGVSVPIALYKIVYDPQENAAYAFILPNRDHPGKSGDEVRPYLDGFRATVAVVERETGLEFLRDVNGSGDVIKKCDGTLWAQ
jgi:endonuclease G